MTDLRPRSGAITDDERRAALACPVRDPLWMLARQWQTGAFVAEDARSPVHVLLATTTAPLTVNGAPVVGPLEPVVEAEARPALADLDTATRTKWASELIRRVRASDLPAGQVTSLRMQLAAALPLQAVAVGAPVGAVAARLPDPVALHTRLATALAADGSGEPFPDLAGVDPLPTPAQNAVRSWFAWVTACTATGAAPARWDAGRLTYAFDVTATLGAAQVALHAVDYDGTGLDWYSFDRDPIAALPPDAGAPVEVRPTPVRYPGMPLARFWAMEDGAVNLDIGLATRPTTALLTQFAHAYSNDWFLVPVALPTGCAVVSSLVVTDTFGRTTSIASTDALDGPAARWRLWELTPTTTDGDSAGLRLFLPVAPSPLESAAIEEVVVGHDEQANLAWLIELHTRDEDGTPVDRVQRWLARRAPADPTYAPATRDALAHYRLGTTVPDHWYPLQSAPPDQLQLAALPAGATDVDDDGVAAIVVPHAAATRIAEAVADRTGTRLTRVHRRIRTAAAATTWTARVHRPGLGDVSAGLRFDVLGAAAPAENLVRNATFARARRTPPAPLIGLGGGTAAAEDWTLWNNTDTTTTTTVEPTARPGGHDAMLHVTTGGKGNGIVQTWASPGTGPAAARATAWVLVVHGQVALGSGDGGNTGNDAISTTTGRWELLQADSGHSPVNEVIVYAAAPDGAEYFVDEVTVIPRATQ